jgi:hypothetical protein
MTDVIRNSTKAIWSLVLGILSMICLGCLTGIPAVICGHMALGEIKKSGGALGGDGLALAGLIMGYISIALSLFVIPLLIAIAIPSFVKIRSESQKTVCMNGQRLVRDATVSWAMANNKNEGDATEAADIIQYLKAGQLPTCPANNLPIAIPAKIGDPVVCPDPDLTEQHTLGVD